MFTSLTTSGDSWQLFYRQGLLKYCYTATGWPVAGIAAYTAAIDSAGRLHIVLTLEDNCLIYTRWQGNHWQSYKLPENGSVMAFSLDAYKQPHFLIQSTGNSKTNHIYLVGSRWQRQILPFKLVTPPLLLKPLSQGQLLLAGQDFYREEYKLFWTLYDLATGWMAPRFIAGKYPASEIYGYWYKGCIFILLWYKQKQTYILYLNIIDPREDNYRILSLGITEELPDDRPVFLYKDKILFFLWTSSNRLTFCLSQDSGNTWSEPQSNYLFFPTRVKAVEEPEGSSTRQVAFTKISGLEPDWPLLINFESFFSLCKSFLVSLEANSTT